MVTHSADFRVHFRCILEWINSIGSVVARPRLNFVATNSNWHRNKKLARSDLFISFDREYRYYQQISSSGGRHRHPKNNMYQPSRNWLVMILVPIAGTIVGILAVVIVFMYYRKTKNSSSNFPTTRLNDKYEGSRKIISKSRKPNFSTIFLFCFQLFRKIRQSIGLFHHRDRISILTRTLDRNLFEIFVQTRKKAVFLPGSRNKNKLNFSIFLLFADRNILWQHL